MLSLLCSFSHAELNRWIYDHTTVVHLTTPPLQNNTLRKHWGTHICICTCNVPSVVLTSTLKLNLSLKLKLNLSR